MSDFDQLAELIRKILIARLTPDASGHAVAFACLTALAKDNGLSKLLLDLPLNTRMT